jgi:hypothetical protein
LKDAARKGDEKSFNFLVSCGHKVDERVTIFGIAPIHNVIIKIVPIEIYKGYRIYKKCPINLNALNSNKLQSKC